MSNFSIRWAILPILAFLISHPSHAAVADGYVVNMDGSIVYLDWGSTTGVKPGDVFTIYRPGAELKHPITGEVLGHEEQKIASGGIESVSDKFCIGKIIESTGAIRIGDRTQLQNTEVPTTPLVSAEVTVPIETTSDLTGSSTFHEFWRSPFLPSEVIGITSARLTSDGKQSIVVAYRDAIEVFQWNGSGLQSIAIFRHTTYLYWLGVEAADPLKTGQDEIFATAWSKKDGQGRIVVLKMIDGKLIQQMDLAGFTRAVDQVDGSRILLYQKIVRPTQVFFSETSTFQVGTTTYWPGRTLSIPRPRYDQAFGLTFGNWDGGNENELAFLYGGMQLRVNLKGKTWRSPAKFGGTRNEFYMNTYDRARSDGFTEGTTNGIFLPRLIHYHPTTGPDQLLVPLNVPETNLRFSYDRPYNHGEITSLAWDGKAMTPVWKEEMPGYLADYAVTDGLNDGTHQIWAVLTNADDKSVLSVYRLP